MQNFVYTARDSAGQACNGTLTAASVTEASAMLRAEGKYPVSVRPAGDAAPGMPSVASAGIKIKRSEVIQMATELAIMVETGVTISDALDCIARQTEKPNVKALVSDLSEHLQGGSSFSEALARHPRSFSRLFIALMRASEKSGMLSKLLNRATAYMRDEQETLRRVRGALTYPGIMLSFAITTTIFLLAFVLPRFTVIYANKKAALPLPTQILMDMSSFITTHWLALPLGTIAVVGGAWFYFRSEGGTRTWHFLQLHLPLLGPMFRKLHLSRGLRTVGTLAAAGVNLLDCVSTARDLCGNAYFTELWDQVSDQIEGGKQLSEPLFRSALVPRQVSQMIFSGEKSGKLGFVMEQVAGFSEQELKDQIAALTRYIEPVMIMIMGVIIGGVALAMLLPVFTISRVMAN